MTQHKLDIILEKHEKWLNREDGGERADFHCADLHDTYLSNANLHQANLCDADLREADLYGTNLCRAELDNANLQKTNLRGADLNNASLLNANLPNADLWNVNLYGASLLNANLQNTNLRGADLRFADLSGTDLCGANLDYSCLPLWCGSLKAQFDDRQLKQIAYHLVSAGLYSKNASEETKRELVKILDFANGFHRAKQCGILKNPFEEEK